AACEKPEGAVRPDEREIVRAQGQGSDSRNRDREALYEERDLHDLLQSDVPGSRSVRRRGGVKAVLQQVEQAVDPGGGCAGGWPLPIAGATESLRRHEARDAAPQYRAAVDG